MKKIIKNNILGFILGIVLMSGIGVVSYSYTAKQVGFTPNDKNWKVSTVDSAINDLYAKAKPKYTGLTTITPTTSSQTLSTKDTVLTKNITINAIPSNYKDITNSTVTSNKILSGYKAYSSDGTLITGTHEEECTTGTYTHTANTQFNINLGFAPKKFFMVGNEDVSIISYDSNTEGFRVYGSENLSSGSYYGNEVQYWHINSNGVYTDYPTSSAWYTFSYTEYYTACK